MVFGSIRQSQYRPTLGRNQTQSNVCTGCTRNGPSSKFASQLLERGRRSLVEWVRT